MTRQDFFNLNRLRVFSMWKACAVLILSIPSGFCYAQQIKEIPLDSGILDRQPQVYWHDNDLNLDGDTSTSDWSVVVSHPHGTVDHVPLPSEIGQIDAIHRSAQNRAVIVTEIGSGAQEVVIIETDPAKLLDKFWSSMPVSLSPDNRYVVFIRFFPMHGAEGYDDQYRLYDVLGTRSTNWPDRPAQDAPPNMPANYDDTLAGVPVYPLKAGELGRMNTFVPEGQEHQSLSSFVWSPDSKRVAFLDAQYGTASIVVVSVPTSKNQHPDAEVYKLEGSEDPCFGYCGQTYNDMHLEWSGDSVKADLLAEPRKKDLLAKPRNKPDFAIHLNIPLSEFVPAQR